MIFNFTQNADNTIVIDVSTSLTQKWFIDAMNEPNIDIIIATCHIDPQTPPELEELYMEVRKYHPIIPFILFSGHRHVLYYEKFNFNSFTLESGKYFEVLGLVEFNLVDDIFLDEFHFSFVPTSLDVCFFCLFYFINYFFIFIYLI